MSKINFKNLIRQITPPLKRQPTRIGLFKALLQQLINLWIKFDFWRKFSRMVVNVYGCQIVLEGFLRVKYGRMDIYVTLKSSLNRLVGLRAEGRGTTVEVGLKPEEARFSTYMRTEANQGEQDVDFIVHIPYEVSESEIRADIERYKPLFSTYKIKQTTKR